MGKTITAIPLITTPALACSTAVMLTFLARIPHGSSVVFATSRYARATARNMWQVTKKPGQLAGPNDSHHRIKGLASNQHPNSTVQRLSPCYRVRSSQSLLKLYSHGCLRLAYCSIRANRP